jgi:hypothetical protein
MYIDESGNTVPLSQNWKNHLVITGCIIDESDAHTIEKQFRDIKLKYYQNPDIEINKHDYWQQYPSQNPYEVAYMFLLERFQKYLEQVNQLGICIIDPREGQVEKHFLGNELSDLHDKMRWNNNGIWHQCPLKKRKKALDSIPKTSISMGASCLATTYMI